jgi:hypothetical protein
MVNDLDETIASLEEKVSWSQILNVTMAPAEAHTAGYA